MPDIDAHEEGGQTGEGLKIAGFDVEVSKLVVQTTLKYSPQNEIKYSDLVNLKFDLRHILKFQRLPAPKATPALMQEEAAELQPQ